MCLMGSGANWSARVAWSLLALLLVSALIWFFAAVVFVPTKWNAYSFDSGGIRCIPIAATGEGLLLIPVEQIEPRAHIDQVRLIGASGLAISGVGLIPSGEVVVQPTSGMLDLLRAASGDHVDLGSVLNTPTTLALLLTPEESIGTKRADGLEIITITGEPAFTQQFAYSIRLDECGS